MPITKCVVPGCSSTSYSTSLHKLPLDDTLRALWMQYLLPLNPALGCLTKEQLVQRKVCQLHFEQKYMVGNQRVIYGCPTLFTDDEITSRQPCKMLITKTTTIDNDHSYSRLKPDNAGIEEPVSGLQPELSTALNVETIASYEGTSSRQVDASVSPRAVLRSSSPDKSSTPVVPHNRPSNTGTTQDTKPERERERIVRSIKNLTPKCKKMYKKCRDIINSKRRLIRSFEENLERATHLSKQDCFKQLIQNLTPQAKSFLMMQVELANKPIKQRRYTTKQKVDSLVFLKRSPKAYELLRHIFILPSRRTLNTFAQTIKFQPGLNINILQKLKNIISSWDNKKRLCSIVFDEVALTPQITFVESEDRVDGFVDFGGQACKKLCDHALVFMIRGVVGSWRQSFAYYLCEGTTPALTLKKILKEVIDAVNDIGLRPKALVCDQGSTFQACLNLFKDDVRRQQEQHRLSDNQVQINGHVLHIIFDPPHLIKGIRNNFLNKDLMFRGKLAKWNDIIEIYKADCEVGDIRMLHKLTDEHVIPEKIKKMKVKNCTQVLSEKTAAMLRYSSKFGSHADGTPVSSTMGTTSEAVLFFDRLFDSVNGSRGTSAPGKMRGPVKEVEGVSKHVEFWQEAIRTLNNIYFVEPNTNNKKNVPSLKNWIITLKSFISIWLEIKLEGVHLFYPRNLNQDPLENFFGRIRALNHRNNSPSPYIFQTSFKSLLITNLLGPQSRNTNCESDVGETLVDCFFLMDNNTPDGALISDGPSTSTPVSTPHELAEPGEAIPLLQQVRTEKLNVHSSAFTAGYVARKLKKLFKCQACNDTLVVARVARTVLPDGSDEAAAKSLLRSHS